MQIDTGRTRINLSFSFVAVLTLMLLLCDEETVLISLFSSLFHEGGHLFFMFLFSVCPTEIIFGAFGIRIERETISSVSYRKEAIIALGGIIGNILLALTGFLFYISTESEWSLRLVAVNVFIASFNMLPVAVLDFGNCLSCIVSHKVTVGKADKILSVISYITVAVLLVICIAYNIFLGLNISFVAVTVYIILITTLKE